MSDALSLARDGLLALQRGDGRFEGLLSTSVYPTLACILLDLTRGKPLDPGYRDWLLRSQRPDGRMPLDPEGRPSDDATRFARVVANATLERVADPELEAFVRRIPANDWNLWLVKAFGAYAGQFNWRAIPPPKSAERIGAVLGRLSGILPRSAFAKLKPPPHLAPPVSLFRQPAFEKLFVAEQYTLAPMLLSIEAHTRKRPDVMRELTDWVVARQAFDGSWFCVGFITAVAALALMAAERELGDLRLRRPIEDALEWLAGTRNPDGGHREAISLNVWDTTLATLALMRLGVPPKSPPIRRAVDWLRACQNLDGGWAFHAVRGNGLPSDADDTALATQVLRRANADPLAEERGIAWLRRKQAKDGSWATYVPEKGDIGCVSVTTRAMEAMALAGEREPVARALRWLKRTQRRDGSWDDAWLARFTYGTSHALIALAREGQSDAPVVRRGFEFLASVQNADGGWGETQSGEPRESTAEQTAFAAQALGAHGRDASRPIRWLLDRQRPDGGWDAAPVGIYWEVIGGYANPMNAWSFPILALTESAAR